MPHILTFVAQGEPPYVIAFGNGSAEPLNPTRYPMSLNFTEMQQRLMIKTTTTSESYLLGGIEKLEPPPEPLPWRTWLLWAVLITGVVLLGWMVWRLARQMNLSPNDQD